MTSIILQTATRFLSTLLLLFSLFLLLRGHDEPGGGFVGGLVAASAFALYATAYNVAAARAALRFDPRTIAALGLLIAAASGVPALLVGEPYLTSYWTEIELRGLPDLKFGTPLLFDVGVYLGVFGVTLTIVLALEEE